KLYSYFQQARARGVKFDVGHGAGSFVFRNAAPAIAQGLYPDSISTDLHVTSMNGPMFDLPSVMSKLMALGMSLQDVVLRATVNPAEEIRHPELGHLTVGSVADVAVWNLRTGDFGFGDPSGGRVAAKQRLECEMTIKGGAIVYDWNARAGVDWHTL